MEAQTLEDTTPMCRAASDGNVTLLKDLLIGGTSQLNTKDALAYRTPLLWACAHNHLEAIKLLCSHPSIELHHRDKYGSTAWDYISEGPLYYDLQPMFEKLRSIIIDNHNYLLSDIEFTSRDKNSHHCTTSNTSNTTTSNKFTEKIPCKSVLLDIILNSLDAPAADVFCPKENGHTLVCYKTTITENKNLNDFRKALVLYPGYDIVGKAFQSRGTQILLNDTISNQNDFYALPLAREAGFTNVISAPLRDNTNDDVLAVFTVYYKTYENKVDLLSVLDTAMKLQRMMCYNNSRLNSLTTLNDIFTTNASISVIRIALALGIFNDFVFSVASSSVSSLDHEAVLNVFVSISNTVVATTALEEFRTRILYFANYFVNASPPSSDVFRKATSVINTLCYKDEMKEDDVDSIIIDDDDPCVLCRFMVPGHIHPGKEISNHLQCNSSGSNDYYFDSVRNPNYLPSPIRLHVEKYHTILAKEFEECKKSEVLEILNYYESSFNSSSLSCILSFRDLYDTIGRTDMSDTDLRNLLDLVNDVIVSKELISVEDIINIHGACINDKRPIAGAIRNTAAVGYCSTREYKCFLPAAEIKDALQYMIDIINEDVVLLPLAKIYYAFSMIVYHIHPFHDGNGRVGRIVGNILWKKFYNTAVGIVFVSKHKDLTLENMISNVLVTLQESMRVSNSRTSSRQERQRRLLSNSSNNASIWF